MHCNLLGRNVNMCWNFESSFVGGTLGLVGGCALSVQKDPASLMAFSIAFTQLADAYFYILQETRGMICAEGQENTSMGHINLVFLFLCANLALQPLCAAYLVGYSREWWVLVPTTINVASYARYTIINRNEPVFQDGGEFSWGFDPEGIGSMTYLAGAFVTLTPWLVALSEQAVRKNNHAFMVKYGVATAIMMPMLGTGGRYWCIFNVFMIAWVVVSNVTFGSHGLTAGAGDEQDVTPKLVNEAGLGPSLSPKSPHRRSRCCSWDVE